MDHPRSYLGREHRQLLHSAALRRNTTQLTVVQFKEDLMVQLLAEFGRGELSVRLETDSAAAKGIVERDGVQRIGHIDIKPLDLKQLVKQQLIEVKKVAASDNSADNLTKLLPSNRIEQNLELLPIRSVTA